MLRYSSSHREYALLIYDSSTHNAAFIDPSVNPLSSYPTGSVSSHEGKDFIFGDEIKIAFD